MTSRHRPEIGQSVAPPKHPHVAEIMTAATARTLDCFVHYLNPGGLQHGHVAPTAHHRRRPVPRTGHQCRCGDLSRGFARLRCKSCGYERLLAFSCKSRICPSCHARRMHDTAFHLEQNVLPRVPYRQWTMTFPRPIRYLMARDRDTITAICAIFVRALFAYQRREAKKAGYDKVLPGAITFVQTFGSALNLNIHFHTLLMDGVFIDTPVEEPITFLELPFVSQQDIEKLLLKIARRVTRMVESTADERFDDDDLDTAALAAAQASATMAALPSRRTASLVGDADQRSSEPAPDRCASGGGFSLHANVSLRARDRKGLLRLIRYGARQCFSQDRLSELPDGRIRYRLSRPWGNQRAITLQPTALLHRLAALIPAPYVNLTRYHGCFAPNARRRHEVINLAFRSKRAPADDRAATSGVGPRRWAASPAARPAARRAVHPVGRAAEKNIQDRRPRVPQVPGAAVDHRLHHRRHRRRQDARPPPTCRQPASRRDPRASRSSSASTSTSPRTTARLWSSSTTNPSPHPAAVLLPESRSPTPHRKSPYLRLDKPMTSPVCLPRTSCSPCPCGPTRNGISGHSSQVVTHR